MKRSETIGAFLACLLLAVSISAQGSPAPYTMRLQTVLTGLSRPILVRGAGDGSRRLFIVQQSGLIKVAQPGSSTATDFINLSSKITIPVGGGDERGLLGLAFHPQFATNGKFYVNYTRVGDGATVVSEYRTVSGNGNQGDITTERILFMVPQPFSNHNGGMMNFGADGYLYIGMGDGGSANDPGNRAQNPAQLLGKMLRIDVNIPGGSSVPYLIPPGNPFVGAGTVRCDSGSTANGNTCQEIWTLGMRNPWRWSFDRGTNQMWVADVGQDAIEEVNVIANGGGNYGWRVYEGTNCTGIDTQLCVPQNFIMPQFQYDHTQPNRCAITGGYVYRGTQGALPGGAYLYGDYCSGEIWTRQSGVTTLLQDTPRLIPSFGEDDDSELYVVNTNGQIDKIVRAKASADFDGDLKSDVSVFRPSSGLWYILNSSNSTVRYQSWGSSGDTPTPDDFDGDNITDISVFRPSTGVWYTFRSSDSTFAIRQFGLSGDIPAAGDYDGDSKSDIAVFRPSTGLWYILQSSSATTSVTGFGLNGDRPTPGDFDGDGRFDIALWRPSDGVWYRLNSSDSRFSAVQFGLAADIPTQGDFDGDGKIDQAVFRPSTGVWYILRSSNGGFTGFQFGSSGDVPVIGDYDGDGKEDIAVYRPSSGVWYVARSSDAGYSITQFGLAEDLPVPAFDKP